MAIDKSLQTGSTTMLLLKLLEEEDLYGYQMIERLQQRSNNIFALKAGTLYPLLHSLEEQGLVQSYEQTAETGRKRKYYTLTKAGQKMLATICRAEKTTSPKTDTSIWNWRIFRK